MEVQIPVLKKINEQRAQESSLTFDSDRDTPKLRALAEKYNVFVGTSSWNYQGWLGEVYKRNYNNKQGEFVKSRFEKTQIEEYVERFPAVGNDASYYTFPSEKVLQRFAEVLPEGFKMNFKVPKWITLPQYDFTHPKKGQQNPDFLSSKTFTEQFYNPIKNVLGDRVGSFMFEFSPFYFDTNSQYTPEWFVRSAFKFFEQIPHEDIKYGVEVRDPEFFDMKIHKYFDLLEYFNISHILTGQTRMPPLFDQLSVPGIITSTDTIIARLLVRPFVKHNEAVEEFEPYKEIQLINPKFRLGFVILMLLAIESKRRLLINVNNRVEGNAPSTIANGIALLEEELGTTL